MAVLVDTNVLVYCFDPEHPTKQQRAVELMRARALDGSARVPHQAIVEFVAAVTRPRKGGLPLLGDADARHEAEDLMHAHPVLYPTEDVLRAAFRGAAVYQLSWFAAHLWAYAECFQCHEILSEDFQHGRLYGTVKAVNPFVGM